MLAMGQVGRHRPGQELLEASAYATSPTSNDDQLDVQDVG